MRQKKQILIILAFLNLSFIQGYAQTDIYVDASAVGANSGMTWNNAYNSLENALEKARENRNTKFRIHVAEGVYIPSQNHGAFQAFLINRGNLEILGGYQKGGGDRDPEIYTTALTVDQNSRVSHILVIKDALEFLVIDGFLVTGANSNEGGRTNYDGLSVDNIHGAGAYISNSAPILKNMVFENNHITYTSSLYNSYGGSIYLESNVGVTFLYNVKIINSSADIGGGICNIASKLALFNVQICDNEAFHDEIGGGGIYNSNGSALRASHTEIRGNKTNGYGGGIHGNNAHDFELYNVLIAGNYAEKNGGGIFMTDCFRHRYTNITVVGNYAAGVGGGMRMGGASIGEGEDIWTINNSIIVGNNSRSPGSNIGIHIPEYIDEATVLYSDESINMTDFFVDYEAASEMGATSDGNFRLRQTTTAINHAISKGNNNHIEPSRSWVFEDEITDYVDKDLNFDPRINGDQIDLGAYEHPDNAWIGGDLDAPNDWNKADNWRTKKPLSNGYPLIFGDKEDSYVKADLHVDGKRTISTYINYNGCEEEGYNTGEYKLIVLPDASLEVLNSTGSDYESDPQRLQIRSGGADKNNGTFIFPQSTKTKWPATVDFYTKGRTPDEVTMINSAVWQFVGIPVKEYPLSKITTPLYIREYRDDLLYWVMLNRNDVMYAFKGYEITRKQDDAIIQYTGDLINKDKTIELTSNPDNEYFRGKHVLSNPYTAPLKINGGLDFGTNLEESVYLFRTGTSESWKNESLGEGSGQFEVIAKENAGLLGKPSVIPSMQGFVLAHTDETQPADITFFYPEVDKTGANIPTRSAIQPEETYGLRITLADAATDKELDNFYLFQRESSTFDFDNGQDATKMLNPDPEAPHFYGLIPSSNRKVDQLSIPYIHDTNIYFRPQRGITGYKLSFLHEKMDEIYDQVFLEDLETGEVTELLAEGNVYRFFADRKENENEASLRFRIYTESKGGTDMDLYPKEKIHVYSGDRVIGINNATRQAVGVIVFDVSGRAVFSSAIASGMAIQTPDLTPGLYLVTTKPTETTEGTSVKVILK